MEDRPESSVSSAFSLTGNAWLPEPSSNQRPHSFTNMLSQDVERPRSSLPVSAPVSLGAHPTSFNAGTSGFALRTPAPEFLRQFMPPISRDSYYSFVASTNQPRVIPSAQISSQNDSVRENSNVGNSAGGVSSWLL